VYDRAVALERLGGDEELLGVALESFREHAPAVLASARAALESRNGTDLHRHLHSLAGSAAMVGAQPLHLFARQVEARAADGALAEVAGELPQLQRLLDQFLQESAGW
jgi:HPt (histidine-containing phosphotransfer) domain-containing protein